MSHFETMWFEKTLIFRHFSTSFVKKKFSSRILKFAKAQETITPLWHSCHRFKFQFTTNSAVVHSVWKMPKKVAFEFSNFGIFNELLSTQFVNVIFARNIKWDFFCDFQTLCSRLLRVKQINFWFGRREKKNSMIGGFRVLENSKKATKEQRQLPLEDA